MTEFAALKRLMNADIPSLAVEFNVGPAKLEAWVNGSEKAPAAVIQSMRVMARFCAPDSPAMNQPYEDSAKPGRGKRVLSFFTGCGGLDLGFEQAGFETVYATDIDPDSCETLRLNIGQHFNPAIAIECANILDLAPRAFPKDIDLVIGGPPCQSFSASGRRAGGAAGRLDQRGRLFEAYCEIIRRVRPKAFVFENVRGILGTNKGEDWKAIVWEFARLGYTLSYRLLDALDYGAPQQRERMFLVGHQLNEPFLFPEPTHGPDAPGGKPHVTAAEAIGDLPRDDDLDSLKLDGGKYSHLLPLVPPGDNYLYFTSKRGYPRPIFAYRSRFSDFLYKAHPDFPVKTIIASPGKYTGPLHWDNRYFSIREYMRLQGFPDEYRFSGNRAAVIRQIGNSVSPHIAYQLALAIADQIFGAATRIRLLEQNRVLSFDRRKGVKAQKTRAKHAAIFRDQPTAAAEFFIPAAYTSTTKVIGDPPVIARVKTSADPSGVKIDVATDRPDTPFASMLLEVQQSAATDGPVLRIVANAFGTDPGTAQALWNAIDEWVQRSSDFHSLFELYGHFTEPHPLFSIIEYRVFSNHPVAVFAKHAANFGNCSQYFPKSHLVSLFEDVLGTDSFSEIAAYLRKYRFDVRSKETNVAITHDSYMVAYPFNLPARRQMNFRVRGVDDQGESLVKAIA